MGRRKDPETTKIERTGKNAFVAHMEDGSHFEGKTDPRKHKTWGKLATKKEQGMGRTTVFQMGTCPTCGSKWHTKC